MDGQSDHELLDELDAQLAECVRLASTRAEHLRLARAQGTAGRLRGRLLPDFAAAG